MLRLADGLVTPIYFLLILLAARSVQQKNIEENPLYRYYTRGLLVKLLTSIVFCFIYIFYFKEGDSLNFFYHGSDVMLNLFLKSPADFFRMVFGDTNYEHWILFDNTTGWPYYYRDANSFFMVRIASCIGLFTFGSYIATSLVLAWVSYTGIWRLFLVFSEQFPRYSKDISIAILFIPSVVFWGSGLLKDTVTLSAVGWYTYAFYKFFIQKKRTLRNASYLFISCFFLLSIKPYILYALLPGSLLWLNGVLLKNIQGGFVKTIITPLMIIFFCGLGYVMIVNLGSGSGKFSVDKILENAVVTQRDLKQDYYGGNRFDIGDFDANIGSMLSKAPIAIASGLYRPMIIEARNPVMLMSGIENTVFVFLSISMVFKIITGKFMRKIKDNPMLLFSFVFALFFAFSVGLTTANFGALVRYRIPAMPFFVASLLIVRRIIQDERRSRFEPVAIDE